MLINTKYKYKNKARYYFRKKKQQNLVWKQNDMKNDINTNFRLYMKNKAWKKNVILKEKKVDKLIYLSAFKRFKFLKYINDQKKKKNLKLWCWFYEKKK